MKKNIFKKVVASLATVVMAAGLFTAMPAEEAKAEDPVTKTIYLVTTAGDENSYAASAWSGAVVEGVQIKDKPFDTWGNGAPYGAVKVQDGLYKMQFKFWPDLSENTAFQIAKYTPGANNDSGLYKAENDKTQWGTIVDSLKDANTTEVWIKLSDSWAVEPTTPVEIQKTDADFAAEAEVLIDDALAVEATKDNKAKYDDAVAKYNSLTDAQKALVDADKVEELNAGIEAIEAILAAEKAAEDAKYTGKITIYAKTPGWEKVSLYGWTIDDSTRIFGDWPGNKELTEMELNPGWYSCTFDMTEAIGVIFNNDNNKEQTGNWENMKPGEYWLDFSQVEGTPDGENTKYVIDESIVSKTAPTGWKTEAAQEVEQENTNNNNNANNSNTNNNNTNNNANNNTNNTTNNKTEEKKGVTVEVALGADAKWDKVFVHAWGKGFETKWPGVEMTKKDGKWYATLDTTLTKLSFVVSNGNGEQTVDIKDVEGKEVKITLGAKNADGKFEGTAAGSAGSTGATGTQKPGDVAPVAIMLAVAALAAVMVVASKKKVVCE